MVFNDLNYLNLLVLSSSKQINIKKKTLSRFLDILKLSKRGSLNIEVSAIYFVFHNQQNHVFIVLLAKTEDILYYIINCHASPVINKPRILVTTRGRDES